MSLDYAVRLPLMLAVLFGSAAVSSCTLLTTDQSECSSNQACSSAFGVGATCGSDGLCKIANVNPRCTKTYPADLLNTPERRLAYKDRIVIGSVYDRSVGLFEKFELSAELAFKQANAEDGVNGTEFAVIFCDASVDASFNDGFEGTEDAAAAMSSYLVSEMGVPALFASARSSETLAAFGAIDGTGVLMVSPSSTSPDLSNLDPTSVDDQQPGLLWRTAPSDAFQSKAIAADMLTLAPGSTRTGVATNVAVVYFQDSYGEALYNAFNDEFRNLGGSGVMPVPYSNAQGLGPAVTDVASQANIDEVLFVSSNVEEIGDFLNVAATQSGFATKRIFLTEAAASNDVLQVANDQLFGNVRASRPAPLDPEQNRVYGNFLSSYLSEYDESAADQIFTSNAYDAGWLLAYGAAWAMLQEEEVTGTTMARGLRKLSDGGGATIETGLGDWRTLVREFEEGRAVNVNGASGSLDYNPVDEETATDIQIWTIGTDKEIIPDYVWRP